MTSEVRAWCEQRVGFLLLSVISPATAEYAGAAPGLVAGVTQVSIKLPDEAPEMTGFPRGVIPLAIETLGVAYSTYATVAVSPD